MSKVAIIGSGIGGLMTGNLLTQKGHDVTIFESHNTPGGYTAGFWREGFYFESGTLSFENSHAINKAMKDIDMQDKIPFTRQYIRWVSPDFDFMPKTADDIKDTIVSAYANEKEYLLRFFAETDKMCRGFITLEKPRNLIAAVLYPFRLLGFMSIARKYSEMTLREFCVLYLEKNSKSFRLFEHMGYPDMSPMILAAAFLMFTRDYWTVKTGMQSWADALAENFRNHGGTLRLKSKVDQIVTEKNTAIGVKSKGELFRTDYVISAGDYKKTFCKLLDNINILPQDFIKKVKEAAVSESFFTVYLGLDLSREQMKKYLDVPHVFYYDYHPEYDIYNTNDEHFFEKTSPSLYSPSLMNPDLAPVNKSSLMIQCMCPHRWMNNWGNGDKQMYKKLKEKVKKALIRKTCSIIPDLEKHIVYEDTATPLTYERYTHNTDGASSAFSWNPKKKFYKNVMDVKVDTPVENLYMGSCWVSQIGGVPSAINAAYKCTKKIT
jgi:phytoene dehydrogenase-like protein